MADAPLSGLEEALDELYGVAPDDFMAARSTLRDRLRDAGHAEAAKELARARRPTTAAWALNQLAREHSELVDDVLDQTRELEAAQAHARPGQADEVREAMAARRRALAAAADAAVAIAARITEKAENHREAIVATLEAGSIDDAGAAALRAGRHVRDTPGRAGFPAASAPKRAARRPPAPKEPAAENVEEREGARTALEAAEAEARDAAERAEHGATAARGAEQRVTAAETAIGEAQANLRAAKSEARDARSTAQELRRAADAAAKAVKVARRRFSNLGG